MNRLLVAVVVGLALSFAMNRVVRPRAGDARAPIAHVIQAALYVLLAASLALLLRRPVFACALVLWGQLAMVLISDAKYRALREPLLFTDLFEMSGHVLRYPRLYLPFLGAGKAFAALLGIAGALYLGVVLETAVVAADFFIAAGGMAVAGGCALAAATARASVGITATLAKDFARLGLVASCWVHWMTELWGRPRVPAPWPLTRVGTAVTGRVRSDRRLPNIVAVQAESFFDARRLGSFVRRDLLASYDLAVAQSLRHGRLQVPSWGANTVRSEFSFLTGVDLDTLGVDAFNPYRRAAYWSPETIATVLRGVGYRTIAVHPYPAGFYGRRRVFPRLGFEQFLDLSHFDGAARCGPYVSDAALARKVLELLAEATEPTFIFAISMESHGPLHLEKPRSGDAEFLYAHDDHPGFADLTVYLEHLRNADGLVRELTTATTEERDRLVCFFGDHVPTMPKVYARLGYDDPRTDYLIWSSRESAAAQRKDLGIEMLALEVLEASAIWRAD